MKLHTGDTVIIISGKDKGKTGTIMRVLPERNHVVVAGVNIRTRHIKKTHQQAGRIVKYEASINASKAMLLDPKTKKPTRIGYVIKDGKKIRIAKRSGEEVKKVRAPKQTAAKKAAPTTEKKEKAADKTQPEGAKQPFWKKLQFGSGAVEDAGAGEGSAAPQERAAPSKAIPRKSAGRGS